jgi:hypothetical protein
MSRQIDGTSLDRTVSKLIECKTDIRDTTLALPRN